MSDLAMEMSAIVCVKQKEEDGKRSRKTFNKNKIDEIAQVCVFFFLLPACAK